MILIDQMEQIVEASVLQFCHQIGQQYHLDEKDLYALWKKIQSSTKHPVVIMPSHPLKMKKKRKKSAYSVFYEKRRMSLKLENPLLTFGEISKKISFEWKQFSEDQKKKYVVPIDEFEEHPVPRDDVVSLKKTVPLEIQVPRDDVVSPKKTVSDDPLDIQVPTDDVASMKKTVSDPHDNLMEKPLEKSPIFDDGSSIPLLMIDLFHQIRASPDTLKREESMESEKRKSPRPPPPLVDSPKCIRKRATKKKEENPVVEKKKSNKRSIKT